MAINIEKADAYKILTDGKTVGSVFIYKIDENHYELDTISILPEHQSQGIGSRAISMVEGFYPDAISWTLQTPEKDARNRHLYEKHGYLAVDALVINEHLTLIQYRKRREENI
jgi:ribosomal protein S18 acetylase RimI-like enzyme